MMHRNRIRWPRNSVSEVIRPVLVMVGLMATAQPAIAAGPGVFSIRDYGAVGDGKTLDTMAINKAIEACAAAGMAYISEVRRTGPVGT